ncbi:hypothetical protein WJX81_002608 [Elliptochloris bilobata]|uniref:Uncharacterized protein n=1 Tax=Elliptochloris bilobata TaxID=381761 RepID=A0AAW1SKH6_9CHLO
MYGNPDAEGPAAYMDAWTSTGQMIKKHTHPETGEGILKKYGQMPVKCELRPCFVRALTLCSGDVLA